MSTGDKWWDGNPLVAYDARLVSFRPNERVDSRLNIFSSVHDHQPSTRLVAPTTVFSPSLLFVRNNLFLRSASRLQCFSPRDSSRRVLKALST